MKYYFFTLLIFYSGIVYPQIGGKKAYSFLNLSPSAKVASLGGSYITNTDGDVSSSMQNPAALNANSHNNLSLCYFNYFAGIDYGMANYARNFKKAGTFSAGIHYANYGKFTLADETSTQLGEFKAADYAFNIGYSRPLDSNLTMGMNVKTIYSTLYSYSSVGLAIDMGATYNLPKKLFTAAAVIRNAGVQLKPYVDGNKEKLPLQIQLALSQGLKHVPIRFHLLITSLQHYYMINDSIASIEQKNPLTGESTKPKNTFADNLARHFIPGIEINPAKSFSLRFSYDYNKRQEMKMIERGGVVGFSFGFGIKIKKFRFDYGRTQYHLAGASNLFTLTTNFSEFYKSNKTKTTTGSEKN